MTRSEAGAGSVLAVALVGALVVVFVLVGPLSALLDARHRAEAAADAAALAAGDVALGVASGVPCARAREVADASHVQLSSCEQRGALVRVRTAVRALGVDVRAEAVAGPSPALRP